MAVVQLTDEQLEMDAVARRQAIRNLPAGTRLVRTPEMLIVVRWDDVRALLRDKRFAGVGLAIFDLLGITDGSLRRWYGSLMFTNEGDVHHRLRSLVQPAFVPRSVEALRETTATIASELLRPVAVAKQGDLVDFAEQLPIRAMGKLIGVADEDIVEFARWSQALGPVFGFMTPPQIEAAARAVDALLDFTKEMLDRRRAEPEDDLITRLLHAEHDGERLTDEEVADMVVNLVVGGHDTSTGQIACTLLTLLEHPDLLDALRADPQLVPLAVEESLRYLPAIPAIPRVTIEAIDHDGLHIDAGEIVVLSSDAANHDDEGYPEPERFLPNRFADDDVNRLMTFGGGAHYCLGAAMARMVVQESVNAVLALPEPLALAEPADALPWVTVLATYPGRLPIICGA